MNTSSCPTTDVTRKRAIIAEARVRLNVMMSWIMKTTNNQQVSISTSDVIGHIQEIEYENRRMKEELSDLRSRKIDACRFYAAAVTVETVATLHDVHPDTVRKYVSLGLIETHPKSMDAKVLIRASDALMLDFSELKKRYRLRNCNK